MIKIPCTVTCLFAAVHITSPDLAAQKQKVSKQLPDPDGKSVSLRKKVKVFLLMGQSNMLGAGKIGPEYGIGHHLGNLLDEPVMILKSCIGNRSLGWNLLPPGSEQYEHDGHV